jgi:hypothetical protein
LYHSRLPTSSEIHVIILLTSRRFQRYPPALEPVKNTRGFRSEGGLRLAGFATLSRSDFRSTDMRTIRDSCRKTYLRARDTS